MSIIWIPWLSRPKNLNPCQWKPAGLCADTNVGVPLIHTRYAGERYSPALKSFISHFPQPSFSSSPFLLLVYHTSTHKYTHHSAFMLTLCTFAALFLRLSISIQHGSSVFRRSEALRLSDTSQLSVFVPAISKLSEETLFRCCWELSLRVFKESGSCKKLCQ